MNVLRRTTVAPRDRRGSGAIANNGHGPRRRMHSHLRNRAHRHLGSVRIRGVHDKVCHVTICQCKIHFVSEHVSHGQSQCAPLGSHCVHHGAITMCTKSWTRVAPLHNRSVFHQRLCARMWVWAYARVCVSGGGSAGMLLRWMLECGVPQGGQNVHH